MTDCAMIHDPILPARTGPDAADPRAVAVAAAAARMRAMPAGRYPLAALARRAGLSRYQFLRAFRAATGQTPHAYLTAQRIALAQKLLRDGHSPADVAVDCGFADQSHLTAAFRRLTGETPANFARATTDPAAASDRRER